MNLTLNNLQRLICHKTQTNKLFGSCNAESSQFDKNFVECGFIWVYGISNIVGYLMPNPLLYKWTVLFQTIQFSISTQFKCQKLFFFKLVNKVKWFQVLLCITNNSITHQSFVHMHLNIKDLFQTIQFSINTQFKYQSSSIPNNSV